MGLALTGPEKCGKLNATADKAVEVEDFVWM